MTGVTILALVRTRYTALPALYISFRSVIAENIINHFTPIKNLTMVYAPYFMIHDSFMII